MVDSDTKVLEAPTFTLVGAATRPDEAYADDPEGCSVTPAHQRHGGYDAVTHNPAEDADSSQLQTAFNIAKNMIGEGMYSLSYGLAGGQTGVVPAVILVIGSGMVSCYTFTLMGRLCSTTGVMTFKALSEINRCPKFAWVIMFVNTFKVGMTCLALAMAAGQLLDKVCHAVGPPFDYSTPGIVLCVISLTTLFPLCLLRNLSFLACTSMLGLCGELWAVIFMQARAVDGTYAADGRFYNATAPDFRPDFSGGVPHMWGLSPVTVAVLCTAAQAYGATYNAPKYYAHLKDATPRRFATSVISAHCLTTTLNTWVMILGYLTFGRSAQGLILENYAPADSLGWFAYGGVGMALIFCFPLAFTALRDNFSEVLGIDLNNKIHFLIATVSLLAIITFVGVSINDVGLVNVIAGGIFGSLISYVFPAVLGLLTLRKFALPTLCAERGIFQLLLLAGSCLAIAGAAVTIVQHT